VTFPKRGRLRHLKMRQPLIEDFSKAILENRDPAVTGEKGYYTSLIMERAYQTNLENL